MILLIILPIIAIMVADERLDVELKTIEYLMTNPYIDAIFCRLFDAYITEVDFNLELKKIGNGSWNAYKNGELWSYSRCSNYYTALDLEIKNYNERKWFGPEFRDIGMFFRNTPHLSYTKPDQRVANYLQGALVSGYVKHYGKAISIKQWEDTCDYYISYFPESYKSKWEARKGNAIHDKSDFGNALILWEDRFKKGINLNARIDKKN